MNEYVVTIKFGLFADDAESAAELAVTNFQLLLPEGIDTEVTRVRGSKGDRRHCGEIEYVTVKRATTN